MTVITSRLAFGCLMVALLCACDRSTTGSATQADTSTPPTQTTVSTTTATETEDSEFTPPQLPAYGVVPTTKRPIEPAEVTCEPEAEAANSVDATGAAPGAPTVTVSVPEGFTASAGPGPGDVAATMTGPDGMTAKVAIAPTTLDAEAAFRQYADQRTANASINSVSLLSGDLCGYSGQELIGILAEKPGQGIDYADRIVHVWTNDGDFLIAVQLEAPNDAPGFDDARSTLLEDFGIRMP
jgi:hypothetical protein